MSLWTGQNCPCLLPALAAAQSCWRTGYMAVPQAASAAAARVMQGAADCVLFRAMILPRAIPAAAARVLQGAADCFLLSAMILPQGRQLLQHGAAGCCRLCLTPCDDTASGGVSCCSTGDAGCCRLCLILGVDASSWHPFRYGTVPGFEHCCAALLAAVNYCYELRYHF